MCPTYLCSSLIRPTRAGAILKVGVWDWNLSIPHDPLGSFEIYIRDELLSQKVERRPAAFCLFAALDFTLHLFGKSLLAFVRSCWSLVSSSPVFACCLRPSWPASRLTSKHHFACSSSVVCHVNDETRRRWTSGTYSRPPRIWARAHRRQGFRMRMTTCSRAGCGTATETRLSGSSVMRW